MFRSRFLDGKRDEVGRRHGIETKEATARTHHRALYCERLNALQSDPKPVGPRFRLEARHDQLRPLRFFESEKDIASFLSLVETVRRLQWDSDVSGYAETKTVAIGAPPVHLVAFVAVIAGRDGDELTAAVLGLGPPAEFGAVAIRAVGVVVRRLTLRKGGPGVGADLAVLIVGAFVWNRRSRERSSRGFRRAVSRAPVDVHCRANLLDVPALETPANEALRLAQSIFRYDDRAAQPCHEGRHRRNWRGIHGELPPRHERYGEQVRDAAEGDPLVDLGRIHEVATVGAACSSCIHRGFPEVRARSSAYQSGGTQEPWNEAQRRTPSDSVSDRVSRRYTSIQQPFDLCQGPLMASRARSHGIVVALGYIGCAAGLSCTTLNEPAETRVWSNAERIYGEGSEPELAVGDGGDAMVLWKEDFPHRYVFASRYTQSEQQWSPGEQINLGGGNLLDQLDISMDAQSNAVAVWGEELGSHVVFFGMPADVEGAWIRPASRIDGSTADGVAPNGSGPRVSMNRGGTAWAVWTQSADASHEVWANRYTRATGWESPVRIDGNVVLASFPAIAVDPNGDAVAVWTAVEETTFEVRAALYASGEGWAAPERFEQEDAADAGAPDVGVDARGRAVVVWSCGESIWSNSSLSGSWLGSVRIDPGNLSDVGRPDVAVYPDGRAVAVWSGMTSERLDVWHATYVPGDGWTTAALLETDDSSSATAPRVAASEAGTAIAVWKRTGTAGEVIEATALVRGTPSETVSISPSDQRVLGDPRVKMDPSGDGIALWTVGVGESRGVWVSHWTE